MGSWGVPHPVLSRPTEDGGYGLASPTTFPGWQFSMLFVPPSSITPPPQNSHRLEGPQGSIRKGGGGAETS